MDKKQRILVVDDSVETLDIFRSQLDKDYIVDTVVSLEEARHKIKQNRYHIAIVDLVLPGENGLDLIEEIKHNHPYISVIAISGQATIETAVNAMKLGADEFVVKPFRNLDLINIQVEKILQTQWLIEENVRLNEIIQRDMETDIVIGNSPAIQNLLQKVQKISKLDTLVLITGETGVGKSLYAELIHRNSRRKHKKFVSVNCGSLTETLLESLLFGHKKGSFTDAWRDKVGYFQEANEGTLFLDEITETSLAFQVKLLKVIESGIYRQVGSDHDNHTDVRIIAATNKDITELVNKGTFREDLYYRLNVMNLSIPPLRERKDDIKILSAAFVNEFCTKYDKPHLSISSNVASVLSNYQWKGNIRELRNAIEHAVILAENSTIRLVDLPEYLIPSNTDEMLRPILEIPWAQAKDIFEREYLVSLLTKTKGNLTNAAKLSGISRVNLYTKCSNYQLDPNNYRESSEHKATKNKMD